MKRFLALVALALFALTAVLTVRTLLFRSRQGDFTPVETAAAVPAGGTPGAVERLATAITFRTVSMPPPEPPARAEFRAFHLWLAAAYPNVHTRLELETVGEHSLLYTWRGSEPQLAPVVLMGHQDVVPVIPGTEGRWSYPPFDGVVAEGWVWGRGAADDKATVIGILEAAESLLAEGFTPRRTIYLAFGHDEELGGARGAARIADLLASRRITDFALVLDEGGAITDGMIPGVEGLAAIIGVAEKGYLSLELLATAEGGHSSSPPESTAIGILGRAITRLEENPFPMRIDGATRGMFEYIGPEMSFGRRLLFANMWLTAPLIEKSMSASASGAATLRTTTAATMFDAGVKDNVLPIEARAVVNFRILPGDTVASVTDRVRELVDDDRIQISAAFDPGREPSPISDTQSEAFKLIGRTLREVVGDEQVLITPYLVLGGTDAKYYSERSSNVFRFLPIFLKEGDLGRVHGTDERISVESVELAVRYFRRLIRNTDGL